MEENTRQNIQQNTEKRIDIKTIIVLVATIFPIFLGILYVVIGYKDYQADNDPFGFYGLTYAVSLFCFSIAFFVSFISMIFFRKQKTILTISLVMLLISSLMIAACFFLLSLGA